MYKKNKIDLIKKISGIKSNKDLASYYDISYHTLNTWIQRDSIPIDFLVKVAQKSNISINELINEDSENELILNDIQDDKKIQIMNKIEEIERGLKELRKLL